MTKYRLLVLIAPLVVILDQGTKWLVVQFIPLGERFPVLVGFFDLVHFRNRGAAFGLLSGMDPGSRSSFFFVVATIAMVVLFLSFLSLPSRDLLVASSLSLIFGGIIGNMIDRCRYGEVVDFLSWHIQNRSADVHVLGHRISFSLEWPAFNVADSAITIAMVLLIISTFRTSAN